MFKNITLKTIHEKRWMILFWFLGVAAMSFLMMTLYSSFKTGGLDQALQNLPKSLQALIGDAAENKTIPGYIGQQIFAFRIPLLMLIMSIVLFGGLLAGDEGEGTLQTLLAQPVSRTRVFFEKFLAGMIVSLVISCGAIIGIVLGLLVIRESFSFNHLLQAVVEAWLLAMVYGTIAFAIGAVTGKRSLAGGVAGLFTFGSYLISSLAANASILEPFQKFLPFHYYNHPLTSVAGLTLHNVLILAVVVGTLLLISWTIFTRRDIYQR